MATFNPLRFIKNNPWSNIKMSWQWNDMVFWYAFAALMREFWSGSWFHVLVPPAVETRRDLPKENFLYESTEPSATQLQRGAMGPTKTRSTRENKGFLKLGYPQNSTNFHRIFHYKPSSILGYPHFRTPPNPENSWGTVKSTLGWHLLATPFSQLDVFSIFTKSMTSLPLKNSYWIPIHSRRPRHFSASSMAIPCNT